MIKRHAELKQDPQKEFRGGKGTVVLEHFMDMQMANGAGRIFSKSTLPPGASVGVHKHEGDFEVYYILEGRALVNDNRVEVELGPGDINYCEDGAPTGLKTSAIPTSRILPLPCSRNRRRSRAVRRRPAVA